MANYPDQDRSFAAQFQLSSTVPKFYRPATGQMYHQIINNNFYNYVDANRVLIGKDASGDFTVTNVAQRNEMKSLYNTFYP